MIPVPMPPEPPDFDEQVRRPGREQWGFLEESRHTRESGLLAESPR